MTRMILLFIAVIGFNLNSWAQPDYTKITFRSKIKEYKKSKPNISDLTIHKSEIKDIVTLLGSKFYAEEEIEDISERIWLSFIDPEKFDFVYKDMAIRTFPDWNKKNVRGEIVLEPNPFWAEWTLADGELAYVQKAFSLILSYYDLMAYSDDAISTKKSLEKLLYTKKLNFGTPRSGDWTNSYLKSANNSLAKKGLIALISNGYYDFIVCEANKKDTLTTLFDKLHWKFVNP